MSKVKGKFETGKVLLLSAAHFFHDVYSAFLAPLLPYLRESIGVSLTFAGLLSVIQRLPTLFNPFVGMLAERTKSRYFVIVTPAITAICMSLTAVAPHHAFLVLLVLISGISSSFFHVPTPVMMRKVSANRIGMGMSFYMVGGELARSVGPVAVIGAIELWGLQGVTYFIPTGILASVILYFRLRRISISENMKSNSSMEYLKVFRKFLPLVSTIALILFFRAAMKSALTFYLPVFIESHGASRVYAGISLSVLQAAGVVGTMLAGTVSDKIGRRSMMIIATSAAPIVFFGFLYTTGFWQMVFLVLCGLFLFATGPLFLAIVNEYKTEHHNFVNSVYMTSSFLIGAVMVMLVGMLGDLVSLDTTYHIVGFLALGSIPFAFKVPRKK